MENSVTNKISKDDIFEIIKKQASNVLFIDNTIIGLSSRFEEDLSADQILLQDYYDSIEEIFLEKGFSVVIDDNDKKEIEKLSDLVELISLQVNN